MRTTYSILMLSGLLAGALPAAAQQYPNRPVRLLVPFVAGGGTDLVARAVAQKLSERTGQQFVVDNRPGAGGRIAMETTKQAAPDGYTLTMISGSTTASSTMHKDLPYDMARDFAPISQVTQQPYVVLVTNSVPVKSIPELIALAKAKPGELNFGSAGNGSVGHFSTEQFMAMTGIRLVHVPFKGAGPAVTDLLGGRLNLMFENLPTILPHVRSGKLRLLAVGTRQRSALAPEFPTVAEEGVPGYDSATVFGVLAPAKTPAAVIARLNKDMVAILKSAESKAALAARGLEAVGSTPQEYGAQIRDEFVRYGRIAKAANIRID